MSRWGVETSLDCFFSSFLLLFKKERPSGSVQIFFLMAPLVLLLDGRTR